VRNRKNILLIQQDLDLLSFLQSYFQLQGFKIYTARTTNIAQDILFNHTIDLVISDIVLDNSNIYIFFVTILQPKSIPVIIVTAFNNEPHRLLCLKLGVILYLIKPFILKELTNSISLIFQYTTAEKGTLNLQRSLKCNNISINKYDLSSNCLILTVNNTKKKLTKLEYKLFRLFCHYPEQILPRTFILEKVWGYKSLLSNELRLVDIYVHRLRKKIECDPRQPKLFKTSFKKGYFLTFNKH